MKIIPKIVISLTLLLTYGCLRVNPFSEDRVIARVGDKTLYMKEVESIFGQGMSEQDSLRLLDSYVDKWVRRQLKIREAESIFTGSESEIDRLVEEYRSSLLTYKLDQLQVSNVTDTMYSEADLEQYYAEHRGDFTLDRPMGKGVIVRFPENFRQRNELKEWICSTGERYQDFVDISLKNDFELTEFPYWTDFTEFMALLPVAAQGSYEKLVSTRGVTEFRHGGDIYYICVRESLRAGDPSPFERVRESIARTLSNQRRQEILKAYEDDLYNAARERNEIEINI